MGKELGGRAALHRPPVGERDCGTDSGRIAVESVEVVVVGQPSSGSLIGKLAAENGIDLAASRERGHGHRRLQLQPRHALGELGGAEQRAARRAGRHVGERAARKRAQPILARQQSAGREDAPLDELTPRDLAYGSRLDDLGSIVACSLRFPLPNARSFVRDIHWASLPVLSFTLSPTMALLIRLGSNPRRRKQSNFNGDAEDWFARSVRGELRNTVSPWTAERGCLFHRPSSDGLCRVHERW